MSTAAVSSSHSPAREWRIPKSQPNTLMGKVVECIREPRPPLQKIGVYVLTFLASIVLGLSILGIPIWIAAKKECDLQESQARNALYLMRMPLEERLNNGTLNIQIALAEAMGRSTIPLLTLPQQAGDYIDFLRPEHLSHSVMQGIDDANRSFYSLRVRDKSTGNRFVVTVFQRYTNDTENWTYGCRGDSNINELFPEHQINSAGIVNLYNLFQKRSTFELV